MHLLCCICVSVFMYLCRVQVQRVRQLVRGGSRTFLSGLPSQPVNSRLESYHQMYFIYTYKVNRCLARYSPCAPPPTNPPTGHQISLHSLAQIDQKYQFWAKFGRFGQKILFFTGEIKSFVTHITENPPRHIVGISFWSGMGRNGQKCQ